MKKKRKKVERERRRSICRSQTNTRKRGREGVIAEKGKLLRLFWCVVLFCCSFRFFYVVAGGRRRGEREEEGKKNNQRKKERERKGPLKGRDRERKAGIKQASKSFSSSFLWVNLREEKDGKRQRKKKLFRAGNFPPLLKQHNKDIWF